MLVLCRRHCETLIELEYAQPLLMPAQQQQSPVFERFIATSLSQSSSSSNSSSKDDRNSVE